jgi:hypothetical protein
LSKNKIPLDEFLQILAKTSGIIGRVRLGSDVVAVVIVSQKSDSLELQAI